MLEPVALTKFVIPQRRKELLSRPRLIRALFDSLDYKLILLIAPAGYGKTSLLVDFTQQCEWPVSWLSLDTLDQSFSRFAAHFIGSIRHRFPAFGKQAIPVLEGLDGLQPDIPRLVTSIVNDAYENIREHFLVVLDDFHLVSSQGAIEAFVNLFISQAAENCHLVLASRIVLSLPDMPVFVARQQTGGLEMADLAFRPDEIQALALSAFGVLLSDEAAQELEQKTEGWITGLLLTAQALDKGLAGRLPVGRGSGVGLYDFLAQQILNQQPPVVRDFLLRTSFLDEFDAGFCELVWGLEQDWPALVSWVQNHNLFVLPTGSDGRGIRYHHLFQEFLQQAFRAERPGDEDACLRAIAAAYARREDWARAHALYQRLGDVQAVTELIEKAGSSLLRKSQTALLYQWLNGLSADVQASHPALLSLHGAALLVLGNVQRGLGFLNQAVDLLRTGQDYPTLAFSLARRATAHRFQGNYTAALGDSQEALLLAGRNHTDDYAVAEAYHAGGMALYHLGNLEEALDQFRLYQLVSEKIGELQNIALAQMELGICYQGIGKFSLANQNFELALAYWREAGDSARLSFLLNNLGWLNQMMGNPVLAAAHFNEALTHARRSSAPRTQAYLLCSLGDLFAEIAAFSSAEATYRKSLDLAEKSSDRYILFYLALMQASLALQMNDDVQAEKFLERAREKLRGSKSDYERGQWFWYSAQRLLASHKVDEAVTHAREAFQLLFLGSQKLDAIRSGFTLAQALYEHEDWQGLRETLRIVLDAAGRLDNDFVCVTAGRIALSALEAVQSDALIGRRVTLLLDRIHEFVRKLPSLRRQIRPFSTEVLFAPPKLVIRALGRAQVEVDGKPVSSPEWVNQRKVRELLFYLLAHPEGQTKEEIGNTFWPDSSAEQLKLQFKNAVYRLRVALVSDVVVLDGQIYRFNTDLDYSFDVTEFTRALKQAETAKTAQKIAAFQAAIRWYTGHFFPDADGTWVVRFRERLRQSYLQALLTLARLQLEQGQPAEAVASCQTVFLEEPCQEEAHRMAMKCYAALGDRSAIVRQYVECRRLLQQELQVNPSLETERLYELLRARGR